jgi:hypothetical protein
MTTSTILSKIDVFCAFAQLVTTFNSSQLEISHVFNGTTPKILHRKWGPESENHRVDQGKHQQPCLKNSFKQQETGSKNGISIHPK